MTESKNKITSSFLRSFADAIDALDEKELQAVLDVAGLKKILAPKKKYTRVTDSVVEDRNRVQNLAHEIVAALSTMTTTEKALEYLDGLKTSRAVLVEAGRMRDVHIVKQDNVETIKTKLIARMVGYRLDSSAIRGE